MPDYFNNAYINTPNCKMFYDRSVAANVSIAYGVLNNVAAPITTALIQSDPQNIPILANQDLWLDAMYQFKPNNNI